MSNTNQVTLEDAHAIAQEHHKTGNLTLADTTYRDILKVIPNDFNSLHYLSIIAYQQGNPEEGIEFIERAIIEKDDFAESWNAYAVMLAQVGREKEAIEKWKKAVELKPNFPEALSNLGNTYWNLGQFKESLEACKKAVELKPDYADAYINLGNSYAGVEKEEKAIETWKKAIELQPINPNAYINIGNALRNIGKLKDSGEYCEIALQQSPNNPKALLNLANVKRDLGELSEAEELYRKATHAAPDFIDAHNNLAIVLIDQLKHEEAITSIKFALVIDPNQSQAYSSLATALHETGQLKEAEKAARKALTLNPDSSEARIDLADILAASDRFSEAETLLTEAMELIPDSPRLYIKLSSVLERANRTDDAIESIDKAIEISPQMPETYHRKGMIYYMSNQVDKALESLDKCLSLNPNSPTALALKSEILQTAGDMKQAEEVARQGLDIAPNIPFLYFTLGKIKKFTADDPDLKKMQELVENVQIYGNVQATSLHFALFKAYEDIGDYTAAFEHLKQANDLKRSSVYFDRTMQNTIFTQVKKTYDKKFMSKFEGKGCTDDAPIFIVGMPRSGTTLTEQIISSHPEVYGAGELFYLTSVEQSFGAVTEENCEEMGKAYIEHVRNISDESKTARYFTDKMPGNFIRMGQIVAAMPNAKIIHCRRNPMDTCLSCFKQLFARGQYWSYNLEEMVENYTQYIDMMNHWRETMPDRFIEINYEDTVTDFENQARKLIDYVGLEWDDACLTPHKSKRAILTASKGQVRKPIYKTSIESWRRYEEQLQPLAKPLQKFVEQK
jgi:tetratricopeptide (TPR) repeat protein